MTKSAHNHGGVRSRQSVASVPEPSYAERARTLVALEDVGSLATHSAKVPGFPFASVMPFDADESGRPVVLISALAMHTQNLRADGRASLLVADLQGGGDVLGAGRVTLIGEAAEVPPDEQEIVRARYLDRHPNARHWVDYGDFGFWRLTVAEVYFVGGFGVMGWVEADDYGVARPDPLAPHADGIVGHMNDDHADALCLLARHRAGLGADQAAMTGIDRLGFTLRVQTPEGPRSCRLAFDEPCATPGATRRALVAMVREARAALSAESQV